MHKKATSASPSLPLFVEYSIHDDKGRKLSSGRVRVLNMKQAQELKMVFTEQGFYVDIVYRLRHKFSTYYLTLEALEELATLANDILNEAFALRKLRTVVQERSETHQ